MTLWVVKIGEYSRKARLWRHNSTQLDVELSCVAIDTLTDATQLNSTQLTQLNSVQPISSKQVRRVFVYDVMTHKLSQLIDSRGGSRLGLGAQTHKCGPRPHFKT